MHPKHISQFQSLQRQNNIWSSSAISKYCPLYPGIHASTNTSYSSSVDSISTHNCNQNSTTTISITGSYTCYSSDNDPSMNINNIKVMDDTILCLTTNSSDEDKTYITKRNRVSQQICNHTKYPIINFKNKTKQYKRNLLLRHQQYVQQYNIQSNQQKVTTHTYFKT